jgi:hypothetical protein
MYRVDRDVIWNHEAQVGRRAGRVAPLASVSHLVELVPIYGSAIHPSITSKDANELPGPFYLNDFADKELYKSMLEIFA